MILVKPLTQYAEQIKEYRQEFLDYGDSMDGCGSLKQIENPYEYIQKCIDYEKEETLPEGRVIATQFMFVREQDNKLVGMIQVRHYFNDYLSKYGGHIGYSVRPNERRKGYGKQMLAAVLPYCKEIGLDIVLITCLEDNIASEKIILANGGKYENTIHEPEENVNLKRYWIKL